MLVRSFVRSLDVVARVTGNSVRTVPRARTFLSLSRVSETETHKADHLARSALSKLGEETCVTEVPGVGPKTLEKLRALGVETVKELRDRVLNELNADDSSDDVPRILKLKLGVRYVLCCRL